MFPMRLTVFPLRANSAAGVSAGYPILSSYAVVFFQDLVTHTQRGALLLNAAIAIIYSAANLSSAAIVERVGRRTLARAYMTINIVLLGAIAALALTMEDSRPVAYSIGAHGQAASGKPS